MNKYRPITDFTLHYSSRENGKFSLISWLIEKKHGCLFHYLKSIDLELKELQWVEK